MPQPQERKAKKKKIEDWNKNFLGVGRLSKPPIP